VKGEKNGEYNKKTSEKNIPAEVYSEAESVRFLC